jgi:hypothetical protein
LSPKDSPDGLDADIYKANEAETGARGLRFAKGFAVNGMKSHIVLAACSPSGLAWEDKKAQGAHGRFTTALLKLLRTVHPDQITYADILSKIPLIYG